jgi:hypothetical protein
MNTLNPAVGSNQFVTKFDEKSKIKKRFKIKFATKVKILALSLLVASIAGNYILLKTFMVFKCTDGGYFISKQYCGEVYQLKIDSQELARQELLKNNYDIFGE